MKKNNLLFLLCFLFCSKLSIAQCTEGAEVNTAITPENCTPTNLPTNGSALNITSYFSTCQSICINGGTVDNGAGGTLSDCAEGGASFQDDFWLFAADPYNGGNSHGLPGTGVPGYDGSLVFSWQDYPGFPDFPPTISVHVSAKVNGPFGITTNAICTDGFTELVPVVATQSEFANVICDGSDMNSIDNNQIVAGAGTIPLGSDVNTGIAYLNYYLQIIPHPSAPAGGNYCFDVSPYKPGFICSDALDIPLTTVSSTQVQGIYSDFCLCESAANGGLYTNTGNTTYNPGIIDPWCPAGSSKSVAWFKVNAPYDCNKITANVTSGTGSYNITVLSSVNCPITQLENPFIAGSFIDVFQDSLNDDRTIEGGQCVSVGETFELAACSKTLTAGEYWICVSSEGPKNTFDLQVDIFDAQPDAGTIDAASVSVCSGSTVNVSSTGSNLPFLTTCSQNIEWKYSTVAGFDPATSGTSIGTGTSASTSALTATGCSNSTYYIIGYVAPLVAGGCSDLTGYKTVTVYPSLSTSSYTVSPSSDQCSVSITPTCPSHTIGGLSTFSATAPGSGAWSTSSQTLSVSGAPSGCNSIVIPAQNLNCAAAVCTPPVVNISSVTCLGASGYQFTVQLSGGTVGNTYSLSDNDASTSHGTTGLALGTTYVMGPYTAASVVVTATDLTDATCSANSSVISSPCVAPVLNTTSISDAHLASGSSVTLTATLTDPSSIGGTVTWFNATTGASIGTGLVLNTSPSASLCSSEEFSYYASFTPSSSSFPSTNSMGSPETVTVYPLPTPTSSYSNAGCTITADDLNCPGGGIYTISGGNVSPNVYEAADPSSGTVTFTYTAVNPNNPVAPVTLDVSYSCGGSCPTFVSAQGSTTGSVCSGTTSDLSITISPAGALYDVEWTGPNSYFSTDLNPTITLSNNKCFDQSQEYFYQVICVQDGSTLATGSISFNVHPDPSFEVLGANTCDVSVTNICEPLESGYFSDIYWGGSAANGNSFSTIVDGESGVLNYTLEQASGCVFDFTVPYNCDGPCVPGADGICVLDEHARALPFVCLSETGGVFSSVELYDPITGEGMSVADGHEVGFIMTNSPSYTAADFAAGSVPIIAYNTPTTLIPNPTADFLASTVGSAYYNSSLWIYAVSLEAPFTAFQWNSSSCLKVSEPAEVVFLLPIVPTISGACAEAGTISFVVQGGLFGYNGTLPSASNISLTDGTSNYTPSSITSLGGSPATYNLTFTDVDPSVTGAYTLDIEDQNLCRASFELNCILSIDWVSFNGYIRENNNLLSWTTSSERDNDYYEILRSEDGINYETIGSVKAVGTTNALSQYTFTDENAQNSYYYQIRAVDIHEEKTTSQIVYLARENNDLVITSVRPVPVNDLLFLDVRSNVNENVIWSIRDLTGKIVLNNASSINKGLNTLEINTSNLSSGMYLLTVENKEISKQMKFVKN